MILGKEKFKLARGNRSINDIALAMGQLLGKPVCYHTLWGWENGKVNPSERLFDVYCKVVKRPKRFFLPSADERKAA